MAPRLIGQLEKSSNYRLRREEIKEFNAALLFLKEELR